MKNQRIYKSAFSQLNSLNSTDKNIRWFSVLAVLLLSLILRPYVTPRSAELSAVQNNNKKSSLHMKNSTNNWKNSFIEEYKVEKWCYKWTKTVAHRLIARNWKSCQKCEWLSSRQNLWDPIELKVNLTLYELNYLLK